MLHTGDMQVLYYLWSFVKIIVDISTSFTFRCINMLLYKHSLLFNKRSLRSFPHTSSYTGSLPNFLQNWKFLFGEEIWILNLLQTFLICTKTALGFKANSNCVRISIKSRVWTKYQCRNTSYYPSCNTLSMFLFTTRRRSVGMGVSRLHEISEFFCFLPVYFFLHKDSGARGHSLVLFSTNILTAKCQTHIWPSCLVLCSSTIVPPPLSLRSRRSSLTAPEHAYIFQLLY